MVDLLSEFRLKITKVEVNHNHLIIIIALP